MCSCAISRLLAHIGVYGHEQGKPQPVRINVDLAVERHARHSRTGSTRWWTTP